MKIGENSGVGTALTVPDHIDTVGGGDDMTTPTRKRTTSPAFQFYPDAFLSSTKVMAMSMTERGIYITLLCACWQDGSLPADMPSLARMVGVKERQFTKIWPHNLARCFTERGGRLVNLRLDQERKKQAEYRARQAANGAKGGRPSGKPTAISGDTETPAKESSLSLSPSLSPSLERTHRQGGAPLHQSHRAHASCGRVCVPADLHVQFVKARNHPNADQELRAWYAAVDEEWSTGAKATANTGGNDYRFWRARFDERWPDESQAAKGTKGRPAWAV